MSIEITFMAIRSKKTYQFAFEDPNHSPPAVTRVKWQVIVCTHRLAESLILVLVTPAANIKVKKTRTNAILSGIVSDPNANIKIVEKFNNVRKLRCRDDQYVVNVALVQLRLWPE